MSCEIAINVSGPINTLKESKLAAKAIEGLSKLGSQRSEDVNLAVNGSQSTLDLYQSINVLINEIAAHTTLYINQEHVPTLPC